MKILLTVPHAICDERMVEEHSCDFIAQEMATELYQEFKLINIDIDIEIGDIPRFQISQVSQVSQVSPNFQTSPDLNVLFCDLNRKPCRDTEFRKKVRRKMKKVDLVIDIHSYPPDSVYGPYDITILEDRKIRKDLSSYSLYNYLVNNGVNVGIIQGDGKNDIMDESHENGIDAFLIEFNEGLEIDRNHYFIKLISDWIFQKVKK